MRLAKLLAAVPTTRVIGPTNVIVRDIVDDSRKVSDGSVFVALRGTAVDSHKYVPGAIERGATVVVTEEELPITGATQVVVPSGRQALAWLSAAYYGFPGRKLTVIGVTGTDGKTTTCNILAAIMRAAGHKVGLVTTVNAEIGDRVMETGLHTTTPSPLEVQEFLRQMVDAGSRYAILETTSHALDQERTLGSEYDIAVVTNVTHDHLDYHLTYEAYLASKGKLFSSLATSYRKRGTRKVSILNADDRSFDYLRQFEADRQITYGMSKACQVWASDINLSTSGTRFVLNTPKRHTLVESSLLGSFNVYNSMAAGAAALSQGVPPEAVAEGIASVKRIVGRLDPVSLGQRFDLMIDFAHTPNALEQLLKLSRTLTKGRVIVVFGCAGLRDREKRPVMGRVAGELADVTIITAEDPRTEDLGAIMEQIAAGAQSVGKTEGRDYWKIGDRGEAIRFAVRAARPGDLVVVTGKGHEQSMCFGDTEYPWSDHEAATKALQELLKETST